MSKEQSFPNEGTHYSYEILFELVVGELAQLQDERSIKDFCKQNGLVYQMVINYKNGKLNYKNTNPHNLLIKLLEAFNYKATPIQTTEFLVTKIDKN